MIINWVSLGIGAGGMLALFAIIFGIKSFFTYPKQKYDLHIFKKLVYDTGIKTRDVYQNILTLEKAFREIEAGE